MTRDTRTVDGANLETRLLDESSWPEFAALVERHHGVFGGCWCTWFHRYPDPPERSAIGNREFRKKLVTAGRSRAVLVFDGAEAIAWAQFGTVKELPNTHHRRQWEAETEQPPDYRITCVFVDKRYRGNGLAAIAVRGALSLIAEQGGGVVEVYPHDLAEKKKAGKKISSSFLYDGTRTMYERQGFTYLRPKGQGNCVMSKRVAAERGRPFARPRSCIARPFAPRVRQERLAIGYVCSPTKYSVSGRAKRRDEYTACVGNDIQPAPRNCYLRPILPVWNRPTDLHGLHADIQLTGPVSNMNPKPRIEGEAIAIAPPNVMIHFCERISALQRRAHRHDRIAKRVILRLSYHELSDGATEPFAPTSRCSGDSQAA